MSVVDDETVAVKREDSEESDKHTFTQVLGSERSQSETFETVAAPLVASAMGGEDALLFPYGVTNAGKTYTVQGDEKNPGILPKTLEVRSHTFSPLILPFCLLSLHIMFRRLSFSSSMPSKTIKWTSSSRIWRSSFTTQ